MSAYERGMAHAHDGYAPMPPRGIREEDYLAGYYAAQADIESDAARQWAEAAMEAARYEEMEREWASHWAFAYTDDFPEAAMLIVRTGGRW